MYQSESPRTGAFARAVMETILRDLEDEAASLACGNGASAPLAVGAHWHWTVTQRADLAYALRRKMIGDWSIRRGRCESPDGVGFFYPRPMVGLPKIDRAAIQAEYAAKFAALRAAA